MKKILLFFSLVLVVPTIIFIGVGFYQYTVQEVVKVDVVGTNQVIQNNVEVPDELANMYLRGIIDIEELVAQMIELYPDKDGFAFSIDSGIPTYHRNFPVQWQPDNN